MILQMVRNPFPSPGIQAVPVRRRGKQLDQDLVVVEEPLEIRIGGKPLVVTMRTPGQDKELAAGHPRYRIHTHKVR